MGRARKAIISRKQASQYPTEYGHKIRKGSRGRQRKPLCQTQNIWFSTANTCKKLEANIVFNILNALCQRPFTSRLSPPNSPDFLQMFSVLQKENQFPTTNTVTGLLPVQMIRKLKDMFIGCNQEKQHLGGKAKISRLNSSIEMTKLCDFAQII